jgi:hypothetical protein
MAPRHADMHLVDPQLWAAPCAAKDRTLKDFFSSIGGQYVLLHASRVGPASTVGQALRDVRKPKNKLAADEHG